MKYTLAGLLFMSSFAQSHAVVFPPDSVTCVYITTLTNTIREDIKGTEFGASNDPFMLRHRFYHLLVLLNMEQETCGVDNRLESDGVMGLIRSLDRE